MCGECAGDRTKTCHVDVESPSGLGLGLQGESLSKNELLSLRREVGVMVGTRYDTLQLSRASLSSSLGNQSVRKVA